MVDPYRPVASTLVRAGAVAAAVLLAALLTIGRSEQAFSPTVDTGRDAASTGDGSAG